MGSEADRGSTNQSRERGEACQGQSALTVLSRLSGMTFPATPMGLVLAPHPDDFDAIAVTLRRCLQAGVELRLVVLTGAASGVEDGYHGAVTKGEKQARREAEQRASCRFFGLPESKILFLRLAEDAAGHLVYDEANRRRLRAVLLDLHPDLVFMPHGNDSNPDHQRCHALLMEIVRADRLTLLACLNRDPKTIAMRTDWLVGFGETEAAWKGELLRFHDSQHQRNLNTRGYGFDERVLQVNRQIAAEHKSAWPYAECFELECLMNKKENVNG